MKLLTAHRLFSEFIFFYWADWTLFVLYVCLYVNCQTIVNFGNIGVPGVIVFTNQPKGKDEETQKKQDTLLWK